MSEDDRASFRAYSSHKEMVADIRSLSTQYEQRSKLALCCRKIATFSTVFAPYFDVVNIFVQIKPDWAGGIWGTIRLIFQALTLLERVSDMFENIAFTLPQYQSWFDLCRASPVKKDDQDRLAQALAFIYADLIDFCLHVYRIFSRAHSRKDPLPTSTRLPWLIVRTYRCSFHQSIEAKDENAKRKEAAEQEQFYAKQLSDIKSWISSLRYRDIYERARRDRYSGSGEKFLLEPTYGSWRNAEFHNDHSGNESLLKMNWIDRILLIHAKPGFGKTYLSAIIIDDLVEKGYDMGSSDQDAPIVAFFHFTSSNRWGTRSVEAALQSIAMQLLHVHEGNRLTLDAIGLLLRKTGSRQPQASMDDVLALVDILLRQYPTYMVIDAVDECDEPEMFLGFIKKLCRSHDCRVLLLSRPTLTLSPDSTFESFDKPEDWDSRVFPLTGTLNFDDIRNFLEAHIRRMSYRGLFGKPRRLAIEESAEEVARRANGMFLWARLYVNYLESPAVTPRERLLALTKPTHLEGIDTLYDRILKTLEKSNVREKAVAADVIQWLSASVYPLDTRTLHTALAIIPGEPTTELQYLVGFPDCIPRITCALVEITETGNLGFIHLSFQEYLETRRDDSNSFSLQDAASVNLHLATRCLSYLSYDIPPKPLQPLEYDTVANCRGFEEASANTIRATAAEEVQLTRNHIVDHLNKVYPFIRYAVLCWYTHLSRGHHFSGEGKGLTRAQAQQFSVKNQLRLDEALKEPFPWTAIFARFLVDRKSVTMWVEACCIFQFLPSLKKLIPMLEYLHDRGSANSAADRELWWIVSGLRQLSGALDDLRGNHTARLIRNPTLIWQNRITAAKDLEFWPVWKMDGTLDGDDDDDTEEASTGYMPDPGNGLLRTSMAHMYVR
ncbi:hypothetical protein NA57DRAFT_80935 [Rhizodiscina lignyota]|uniref:NACHT domain-containing protein n=1 Tax=Rhizodiscina lignyota TaxID=1504668 RepID=A0A9P4I733_9PEZI|nr:hypothetical protein NA57DRAFT_80935 [Rhizodiscina lignyota]